uniref:Uncharacterized protein n=1 Tax=Arundo donax TaxID=35708 RepID=A0A0A9G4J3_ARUDO
MVLIYIYRYEDYMVCKQRPSLLAKKKSVPSVCFFFCVCADFFGMYQLSESSSPFLTF